MTDLTCRQVSDFLMAYLDHELDAETRATFELHLAQCEECVRYLRDYQATIRLAKNACEEFNEREKVPERLIKAILAARKT